MDGVTVGGSEARRRRVGTRGRGGRAAVLAVALAGGWAGAGATDTWSPGANWALAWADEFAGTAVDETKWTYDLGAGGWGNAEWQTYTAGNAVVRDGELVIEARRNPDGSYSSARLKTQGRAAWRYGKFAARIRLPHGQGIWPAFWMLGDNFPTVGWPRCGEIDIMEMVGGGEDRDDSVFGTLHWDANGGHAQHGSARHELPDPLIFNDGYHVFEIEWNAREIIWRRDGNEFFRTSVDTNLWPTMDEFHREFFLILNVAVGGNWPGYPNASTVFPQAMHVDWVRVYQELPAITAQPTSRSVAQSGQTTFTVAASGTSPLSYQWRKNGTNLPGATSSSLTISAVQPAHVGVYSVAVTNAAGTTVSNQAILGVEIASKVQGTAFEHTANITHPNGNVYDQFLLTGTAATIRADAGQIVRASYVDLSDDIVQIEFSGAGSLTVSFESVPAPAPPVNYNQSVDYVRGHATLTIAGADQTSNVSVFSVGRLTAFDPTGTYDFTKPVSPTNDPAQTKSSLFKAGTTYDGIADIALINIISATGQFGGVRCANAQFFAVAGLTGVNLPGVNVVGPVNLHDIEARDHSTPVVLTGTVGAVTVAGGGVGITGGEMLQVNGQAVQVADVQRIAMLAGVNSHNGALPAKTNQAAYKRNGVDVTAQLVVNPL